MEQRSKFTVRTSDRRTFRRCFRKWSYISSLKKNLTHKGTEQNINFWFGSAIHFVMEDFYGYNKFKDPRRALKAYYDSFDSDDLPEGAESHLQLGYSMLSYYLTWYERHNQVPEFETIWFDKHKNVVPAFTTGAEPAVEQRFNIPLGIKVIADVETDEIYTVYKEGQLEYGKGFFIPTEGVEGRWMTKITEESHPAIITPMFYHGTMDRLVIDRNGNWWILDYKTAKSADTNKLDTDDQIAAYLWAAEIWFQHSIQGFIYLQLTKDVAREPKRLKDGSLSADKRQKTTYSLFKQELIDEYESLAAAPNKYIDFLDYLAMQESPEGDRFIRWDLVKRTKEQIKTTYKNIMAETELMLNLDYCYPNPTRDCIWDCPIRDMCLMEDREEFNDINIILEKEWEERSRVEDGNIDPWRENIKWPEADENLVPIDQLIDTTQQLTLEIDSQASQGETGFTFMYEKE